MRDLVIAGLMIAGLGLAVYRPFAGIMLWSWISFMNFHQLSWGFASGLPWAFLAFAATVAGCVLQREPRHLAVNGVTVLLLVFLAGITFTSVLAIAPPEGVWDSWERAIKVIVALTLTACMLDNRHRIDALVWLMVLALGFFGVRGGLFTLVSGGGYIVVGPPSTMIADRNHLAVGLLVTLPLMNYLRMHAEHAIVRHGLVAAMVLTLFSAIGTQSRGALIALVATAALFWLRSRGKVISGIAVLLSISAVVSFMPDSWVERMRSIDNFQSDRSAMGRVEMWGAAIALAVARPFTGGGFRATYSQEIVDSVSSSSVVARATHSIWFETLGDHGFLVFGIWLGIILAAIYYTVRITRLAKQRPDLQWAADLARMSQASIVAYCVGGSLLSLSYWDFFWTLCVVIGATHAIVAQAVKVPSQAASGVAALPQAGRLSAVGWRAREARQ